jgi:hypothetical protein
MKRTETPDTITVKLLERLCMGDDSALERLYLTLRQRFLFVALNFFRDEHEAQTAVSYTHLRAHET